MARINIEDGLFIRGEWMHLIAKTGSPDTALGSLIRVFMVAQRFWFPKRERIPREAWNKERLNDAVIECGLAEENENGIYVIGAKEQFEWLFLMSENGKKSAKSRKKRKPPLTAVDDRSADVEPQSTSLLSSLNSSLSSHNSSSSSLLKAKPQKTQAFIAGFTRRYKAKHGFYPEMKGKPTGIAKRIADSISEEKFDLYLDAFFSMPDSELLKKKHPIFLFEMKLNEIVAFAKTGEFTTFRQAQQNDASATNMALLKKYGGKT